MPRTVQNYSQRVGQNQETQLLTFNSDFRTLKYETVPSNARGARPLLTRQIPRPSDSEPTINLLNETRSGFQFNRTGFEAGQGGFEIPGIGLPTSALGGDYILRGGILQPIRLVEDTVRLTKWFFSLDGLLFTAKQNQLARGGFNPFVRDEKREGIYVPTSTILAASLGANNGIHLNKQGLNPFAPTDGDGGRSFAEGNQEGSSGLFSFLTRGRPFYLGEDIVGGAQGTNNKLVERTRSEIGEFNINTFQFEPGFTNFGSISNPNERESIDSSRKIRTGLYKLGGALDVFIQSDLSDDEDRADYQNALTQLGGEVVYSGSEAPPEIDIRRRPVVGGASDAFSESNISVQEDIDQLITDADNGEGGLFRSPDNTIAGSDRNILNNIVNQNTGSGFFRPDFRAAKYPSSQFIGPDYERRNIEQRVGFDPGLEGSKNDMVSKLF